METALVWTSGFFVGLAVVGLLRKISGLRVWIAGGAVLSLLNEGVRADYNVSCTWSNLTANSERFVLKGSTGGGSQYEIGSIGILSPNSGVTQNYTVSGTYDHIHMWFISMAWTVDKICDFVAANGSYSCILGGGPTYTNYVYNADFCSTNLTCRVKVSFMTTTNVNLPVWDTWVMTDVFPGAVPPDCVTIRMTNVYGVNVPYYGKFVRSGCQEEDYVPKVIDQGDATPHTGGTADGVNMGVDKTEGDATLRDGGAHNGDTNRTDIQVMLDAARSIRKAIDEQTDLMDYDLDGIYDAIQASGGSQMLTNIETYTHSSMNSVSNMAELAWRPWTNNYSTGTLASVMAWGSNAGFASWNSGELSGLRTAIHGLTNGIDTSEDGAGAGPPDTSGMTGNDSPWHFNLGTIGGWPMIVDMDPLAHSIASYWAHVASWINFWVRWGIVVTGFWLLWGEMKEQLQVAILSGVNAPVPTPSWAEVTAFFATGSLSSIWTGIKTVVAGVLAIAVTLFICMIPTVAIAFITGWLWEPMGGSMGVSHELETLSWFGGAASGLYKAVIFFWSRLNDCVPFTVLFVMLANVAVARFYLFGVFIVVVAVTRFLLQANQDNALTKAISIALAFGALSTVTADAVQVRVENLSAAAVPMTNEQGEVWTFPSGTLLKLALQAGDYGVSTGVLTLVEDGRDALVQFRGGTNGVSVAYAQSASVNDSFLDGFVTGMSLGGTVWIIMALWRGLRIGIPDVGGGKV